MSGPRRPGLRQIGAENFDWSAAIGGVRGIVESVAPVVVFLTAFLLTDRLGLATLLALVVAAVLLAARLLARSPLTQAAGGFAGVAVCAGWAWVSGSASGYFAPGLLINAAYGLAALVSAAVRYPAIGFIDAMMRGRSDWRTSPKMGRYYALTIGWAGVFFLRLAVQWPLYAAGEVAALGAARLVMGLPLFAVAIFFTWLTLREPDRPAGAPGDPAAR